MAKLPRPPTIPQPARETLRHALLGLLRNESLSAHDLSAALRIREKDVYAHLEHLRRSLGTGGEHLEITPAQCRGCGFVFAKRERLTPPGKCPACRKEAISDPRFRIILR
ncbi:transcriptional regulator [Geoalkalibacter halelectricus]|uniref:Transcriptional regulator n=1 Tax=Geoalkalibacter halelectricus TaxID=2847045 RepID=A0ABY5ZQK3_9BACT|nr:transcriptional regulator [Geoalkalibacter halelectricus]MDO3376890.1 transcriptional regulator [Geoalkalibacter halelectricus]UWZ81114.1 transcriptional regulator [Geoalkalibacter halelectricus]